ncbi:hypothetical protein LNV09_07430 [Paucibacter sp. B2R-40]|uniref:hypothetical protein n=1 Tax=Paucibacter sp. B2R-40 TaxID=2893554 RepID=UPI0021E41E32|nr:hypothetical protein [Paucibacter sp. B2R-40]MCV2353997.1 hypothetical protein [Paucibacter sp. B2R-40]
MVLVAKLAWLASFAASASTLEGHGTAAVLDLRSNLALGGHWAAQTDGGLYDVVKCASSSGSNSLPVLI